MKYKDEIKHLIVSAVVCIGGHYQSSEELFETTKTDFNDKAQVIMLFKKWIDKEWKLRDKQSKIKIIQAFEVALNNQKFDFQEISDRAELPLEQSYNSRQLFEWLYQYLNEITEETNGQAQLTN
jgi:hypothetical protein